MYTELKRTYTHWSAPRPATRVNPLSYVRICTPLWWVLYVRRRATWSAGSHTPFRTRLSVDGSYHAPLLPSFVVLLGPCSDVRPPSIPSAREAGRRNGLVRWWPGCIPGRRPAHRPVHEHDGLAGARPCACLISRARPLAGRLVQVRQRASNVRPDQRRTCGGGGGGGDAMVLFFFFYLICHDPWSRDWLSSRLLRRIATSDTFPGAR